jgi:glutaminyl-tRNA synthetase
MSDAPIPPVSTDFIREIVAADIAAGTHGGKVQTRFPPEPNGYLHIGHAKSVHLNFGIAREFGGSCNLRMDDTNPEKEEQEYVDSIVRDVRWLGYDWGERFFFASDYYEELYRRAEELIGKGLAFVCDLSADEMREHRGTLTDPGRPSPWRDRPVAENLDLFRRMRSGEFPDGARTLRAKIDMASPNINLRDPVLYRILRATHHRTGDTWCIYPMYDYAHPVSDALEGITHSICTLEFEDHRPLYDWCIENLDLPARPRQYEFARLNLTRTVLSKRKLLRLVKEGLVTGWDDPRMPTISGLRRRGYTPEAIATFCGKIGVAKRNSTVDAPLLEHCLREDLNRRSPRRMAVLRPLKLVITDWPDGKVDWLPAENNPEDPASGAREIPFSGELFVEQEDFRDDPPPKWFRLAPGREVRLKHSYLVTCREVVRDATGAPVELRCTHDPASRGGDAPDGRKVKGTLHWVSAAQAVPFTARLYDQLFTTDFPEEEGDFLAVLNGSSLETLPAALAEPSLANALPGEPFQFLRLGYFCVDSDSSAERLVLNRTITLKDSWGKLEKQSQG